MIDIKKIKKIILITFILFIAALSAITYKHKKENKPFNVFGNYISVVISGSMEPTIKTNDLIVYKKSKVYEVDDIIVFVVEDYLVVHRIIEKTEDGYITKGDNNSSDDFYRYGYIKKNQIVGKVTKNFRLFGLGKLLYN